MPQGARPELSSRRPSSRRRGWRRARRRSVRHRPVVELGDVLIVLARGPRQVRRRSRPAPRMDGPGRPGRGCPGRSGRRRAPRPAAQPASPGAGGTNRRSNPDSASSRALATPFSATPPPKHKSSRPVSRWSARAIPTSVSSSTRWTLAAQSAQLPALRRLEIDRIVGVARRPEQLDEAGGIRSASRWSGT